jgi:REP element-mobilizing transposase RayT
MPRTARTDWPGAFQHVFCRGIEKRDIFVDDQDREFLAAKVQEVFERTGTSCFAWCFMPNHTHFAIRAGECGVSHVMQCINTSYALYFNRRWERVGPLFQGRFGSEIHDGEDAEPRLMSYVFRNALRPGLCQTIDELQAYVWSGLRELLGLAPRRLVDVDAALRSFGADRTSARKALLRRLRTDAATAGTLEPSGSGILLLSRSDQAEIPAFGLNCIVAPDQRLVQLAQETGGHRLRHGVWVAQGGSLDALVLLICGRIGTSPELLASGRRCRPEAAARAAIAHVACDVLGEPMASVARATGTTRQAIRRCRVRGPAALGRFGLTAEVLVLKSSQGGETPRDSRPS